ncbi:unnamed protein product [Brassica rapa subsp. narinosa]
MKFRAIFSSKRLRQGISTVYPAMTFLQRPSSSSMMIKSQSEENLSKLSDCMDNMDDDVSKMFMECHQTDFRQDPELLRLLSDYFTTSKSVTELCESLRKCLERAERDECFLIDETLRDFHEEKNGYGDLLEASFRKTFQDLSKFSNHGDDVFSGEFLKKLEICHRDLGTMIVKLESTMKDIDKKLRRLRGGRAVVAAAMIALVAVGKIVAGIFVPVPVEAVTNFAASRWRESSETLKREKTAVTSMERETMVALKEVEKMSRLVSRLEAVERSIRLTVDIAVNKRSSVAFAMGGMEEELKKLKSTLVDLDRETGRCDGFVQFGRTLTRDRIFEFLSCDIQTYDKILIAFCKVVSSS